MFKRLLPSSNERGIALVAALVIMALLIVLGTIALNSTVSELQVTGNDKRNRLAFYAAESGVQFARARIRKAFDDASNKVSFVTNFQSSPPDFTPPSGYAFTITALNAGTVGTGTAADPYLFRIESQGTAPGSAASTLEVLFHLEVLDDPLKYAAYGKIKVDLHKDVIVDAYDSSSGASAPGEADVFSKGTVDLKGGGDRRRYCDLQRHRRQRRPPGVDDTGRHARSGFYCSNDQQ